MGRESRVAGSLCGADDGHLSPAPFSDVGGSVAEWLACWTQAQKGLGSNRSRDTVGQIVHAHRASVRQAAKLATALLMVATVTAGLAESNRSQHARDVRHKPCSRLRLLSARPAVTPVTLKRAATNFAAS